MTTEPQEYHVLTKVGDASSEVEEALGSHASPAAAGLHRYFYVERARQTVVMATYPEAPIARSLRASGGWLERGASPPS